LAIPRPAETEVPRLSINIAAALVLALAFSLSVGGDFHAGAAERPTLAGISQGLTCQCGCGLTVANCNHPTCSFSVPVREQIESKIAKGESAGQIIGFYRAKFGEKVLSAPTTEGFNILAWVMPFVAVVLGGALIFYTTSRWHDRPAKQSAGNSTAKAASSQFDPDLKRRLENELRERT